MINDMSSIFTIRNPYFLDFETAFIDLAEAGMTIISVKYFYGTYYSGFYDVIFRHFKCLLNYTLKTTKNQNNS